MDSTLEKFFFFTLPTELTLAQLEEIPRKWESRRISAAAIKDFNVLEKELEILSVPLPNVEAVTDSPFHGINAIRGFDVAALKKIAGGIFNNVENGVYLRFLQIKLDYKVKDFSRNLSILPSNISFTFEVS